MNTKQEAKKLWCPMIQISAAGDGMFGDNRGDGGGSFKCVASECMAWRWDKGPTEGMPRTGYCGLAGKP